MPWISLDSDRSALGAAFVRAQRYSAGHPATAIPPSSPAPLRRRRRAGADGWPLTVHRLLVTALASSPSSSSSEARPRRRSAHRPRRRLRPARRGPGRDRGRPRRRRRLAGRSVASPSVSASSSVPRRHPRSPVLIGVGATTATGWGRRTAAYRPPARRSPTPRASVMWTVSATVWVSRMSRDSGSDSTITAVVGSANPGAGDRIPGRTRRRTRRRPAASPGGRGSPRPGRRWSADCVSGRRVRPVRREPAAGGAEHPGQQ